MNNDNSIGGWLGVLSKKIKNYENEKYLVNLIV